MHHAGTTVAFAPPTPARRHGARVARLLAPVLLAAAVGVGIPAGSLVAPPRASAAVPQPYAGGGVLPFGDAATHGTLDGTLASLVTGMAATPDGGGYWLVGTDGGVFAFGDAPFEGSLGAEHLNGPIVGMAATPDGKGYWLAALDGGVFAFGDAAFYGSMGATHLNQPIVGMAATPDGKGYWLAAADGGVFAFGDAAFSGSMGASPMVANVVGMAATLDGKGYWLVAGDGGVFCFGDAAFSGSLGNTPIPASVMGMARTPDGHGYWLVGNDGSVYPFGDAQSYGSTAAVRPVSPVTAIAATPDGKGYWLLEPDDWSYSFSDPPPYSLTVSRAITSIAAGQVAPDPDNARGRFCNPYGPCEAWCSLFATWVWGGAGIPIPSLPFTGSIFSWAASNSRLLAPSALAAPGDAILYGTGPWNTATSVHTGIVVQVWPDGAVLSVEGDAGPAPFGQYSTIVNGPFLPMDSSGYNGVPVYAFAQPVP